MALAGSGETVSRLFGERPADLPQRAAFRAIEHDGPETAIRVRTDGEDDLTIHPLATREAELLRAEAEPVGAEGAAGHPGSASPADDPAWPALLHYLHTAHGFDFHEYKTNTVARRIRRRMSVTGVTSCGAYQDYLGFHPEEFASLFDSILVNVTSFFRDPPAWEALRTLVVPAILEAKAPDGGIRAWSAGCATGQEAFSIAMVLAEHLGEPQFRKRVTIYATDLDEGAVNTARHGAYTSRQVEGVPPDLLARYFQTVDRMHVFRPELRRQIIFGGHDLINDAPISRVDLLVCRNTLMYFRAETQAHVLARLHGALNEGGFLLLGRAETLLTHEKSFAPIDLKRRISRKVAGDHGAARRSAARDGSRTSSLWAMLRRKRPDDG
jgi:two-component system, chemotaxis family, CheB/CheR fusion protein